MSDSGSDSPPGVHSIGDEPQQHVRGVPELLAVFGHIAPEARAILARTATAHRLSEARILEALLLAQEVDEDGVIPTINGVTRTKSAYEVLSAPFPHHDPIDGPDIGEAQPADPWDTAIGPFYDDRGVVELLHRDPTAGLDRRVERGEFLVVHTGSVRLYPSFQFTSSGETLPGLVEVIEVLSNHLRDPWEQALWLTSPLSDDDETSAATMLREGRVDEVLRSAREDVARWTERLDFSPRKGHYPAVLTRPEAAEMLGVSLSKLAELVTAGELPARRVGNHYEFKRSDVERLHVERLRAQLQAFEKLRALEAEMGIED